MLLYTPRMYVRGEELYIHSFLASTPAVGGDFHPPGRFTLGQRISHTHRIGGWVSPRANVVTLKKTYIPCF
jgi:hypothetical protein